MTKEGIKHSEGKLAYEIDWEFIEAMAKRMSINKDIYPPYNWQSNKIDLHEIKQALSRHFVSVMKNEFDDDQELGHIVALACNAMIIYYHVKTSNI